MKILSQTNLILVGSNPMALELPSILPAFYGGPGAAYLMVLNLGAIDALLAVTPNADPLAAQSGTNCAPGPYSGFRGRGLSDVALENPGPYCLIPITAGGGWLAAVTIPNPNQLQAMPTISADASSTTITVNSIVAPDFIAVGATISATGIPAGTTVTAVSGSTVTISQATTAAIDAVQVQVFGVPSPIPPALLAIALAADDD